MIRDAASHPASPRFVAVNARSGLTDGAGPPLVSLGERHESARAHLVQVPPFAEFPDFPQPPSPGSVSAMEVVSGDCGKSHSGGFEPANGKGAAARAACYFRLRYPGRISVEEVPEDRWDVVVTWHEQDPVTIWERHRNAAIFERQGNRNPFIDHPEWLSDVTP